jgi:hypothetical protein
MDKDKHYLVYLQKWLVERPVVVELPTHDIYTSVFEWEARLVIEEVEWENWIKRAWELSEMIDWDRDIKFIGLFKGDRRIYKESRILEEIEIYEEEIEKNEVVQT